MVKDLGNGFIVESEDEIKVTQPKAKGGLSPKGGDLIFGKKKRLSKYGLEIASDYFSQAMDNIKKAQQIINAVNLELGEN